jgi:SAM-dependent methyltransferase
MAQDEHGLTRFGSAAQADEWDARYSEHGRAMWSGRPNGRLLVEVGDLTPGRALDIGCGEGADAIWLARRGWTVTGIDISEVAVDQARAAAELAGAAVEWICGVVLRTALPASWFDFVSMQYPALPKAAGEAAVRTLLDTVRPGGLLLAVYHDLDDEHREQMKSRGIDPADYLDADELDQLLGDDFTVERRAVEPRIDPRRTTRISPTSSCAPGGADPVTQPPSGGAENMQNDRPHRATGHSHSVIVERPAANDHLRASPSICVLGPRLSDHAYECVWGTTHDVVWRRRSMRTWR